MPIISLPVGVKICSWALHLLLICFLSVRWKSAYIWRMDRENKIPANNCYWSWLGMRRYDVLSYHSSFSLRVYLSSGQPCRTNYILRVARTLYFRFNNGVYSRSGIGEKISSCKIATLDILVNLELNTIYSVFNFVKHTWWLFELFVETLWSDIYWSEN